MPGPRVLTASFVCTAGERDRIYVTRTDGSQVSWGMASYGEALPHDLVHLVVESAFGVAQGFWGRVNGGADPGAIARQANRKGGRDKYAAFGPDQRELQLAEHLANLRWLDEDASASLVDQASGGYAGIGAAAPPFVTRDLIEGLRAVLARLTARWRALGPKGSIVLEFDAVEPGRGFARLVEDVRR